MAFKGPSVPHRTGRSIALEKGTRADKFQDTSYCGRCGVPLIDCKGHYADAAAGITPVSRPSSGAKTFK